MHEHFKGSLFEGARFRVASAATIKFATGLNLAATERSASASLAVVCCEPQRKAMPRWRDAVGKTAAWWLAHAAEVAIAIERHAVHAQQRACHRYAARPRVS
ncbi:hypothetical protein [Caballeronia telluris]|uniref:hypothetical protein n=1 Tax=Caballeronia telluris TaxID=326475 RepID=UPI000F744AD8|nr:hypothetical protein [Caballeronia telluris]